MDQSISLPDEMTSLADGVDAYGRILVINPSGMENRGEVK
jgi:hypothetical protein